MSDDTTPMIDPERLDPTKRLRLGVALAEALEEFPEFKASDELRRLLIAGQLLGVISRWLEIAQVVERITQDVMGEAAPPTAAAWIPFEDRPRPPELGRVTFTTVHLKRIEIIADDEAAIGAIFAWLLGQAQLARNEEEETPP
jgi:hypothetical protein